MRWIFGIFIIFCWTQSVYTECCPRKIIFFDTDGSCSVIYGAGESSGPAYMCAATICNDGKHHDGFFCGIQSCNIFGCNCGRGCFGGNGDAVENFNARYGSRVRNAMATEAQGGWAQPPVK